MNNKRFGTLLKNERMKQKITARQLGEGLYLVSMMKKIESGERFPEKWMRDRLLQRLGISDYNDENFLFLAEYDKWGLRTHLLDALEAGKLEDAKRLLEQYKAEYDSENKLEHQFYLMMQVQYRQQRAFPKEQWFALLEEAVKLTVPQIDKKPCNQLLLSIDEVNLVLEYQHYRQDEPEQQDITWYVELFRYAENKWKDQDGMIKSCSKIALYFCRKVKQYVQTVTEQKTRNLLIEDAFALCNESVEYLIKSRSIYFLLELLQEKIQLLQLQMEMQHNSANKQMQIQKEQEQSLELVEALKRVYAAYDVLQETNANTYFYREFEIYCINDVIQARRKMFEDKELELTEICSERTLRRIKNKIGKVQLKIALGLFQALGLPAELQRASVITECKEAIDLKRAYQCACVQEDFAEAKQCLVRLKNLISMENVQNQQYIWCEEAYLLWRTKDICTEQYVSLIKTALEKTIPLQVAVSPIQDMYVACKELEILNVLATFENVQDRAVYRDVLKEYCEQIENQNMVSNKRSAYQLTMGNQISWLSEQGQFESSRSLCRKLIKEQLRMRVLL